MSSNVIETLNEIVASMDKLQQSFERFKSNLENLNANVEKKARPLVKSKDKEYRDLFRNDFSNQQTAIIKSVFHEAMQEFYDSYDAVFYERSYGLFNILEIKYDSTTKQAIYETGEYDSLYNESNMTKMRNGGSLYDLVFKQGYHGGADHGQAGLEDPHPGGGYLYRRPGFIVTAYGKNGWKYGYYSTYGKWGRSAVKTTAPYDLMLNAMNSKDEEIEGLFHELEDSYGEKFFKDVSEELQKIANDLIMEGVDFTIGV